MLLVSFERHLRAVRMRPSSIDVYLRVTRLFLAYSAEQGFPDGLNDIKREHVEMWLADLEERGLSSHTQHSYYQFLRQWFRWLLDAGEIQRHPMERMRAPMVDEVEKDVVDQDTLRTVINNLKKAKRWRDLALLSVLYDTGMRIGETVSLEVDDLDLDRNLIRVRGTETKGRRIRTVAISPQCAEHLDRYLRRRSEDSDWVFVGRNGQPLSRGRGYSIIREMFAPLVKEKIGPHDLRHTSATHTSSEMSTRDQMTLYGWKSERQAARYSRQAHEANAIAAHRRASPLDRLGR